MGRIVVGVDGSKGSREALLWSIDEAALRGASLEVIHTYDHHLSLQFYAGDESVSTTAMDAMRQDIEIASREAARSAQALVDRMVEGLSGCEIRSMAIESARPAQTLVEHSRGADLLVVGSRGRGGFKSLMLGSVSQQCAQHAECPVVIIRSKHDEQG